jgi:hypothetical protein
MSLEDRLGPDERVLARYDGAERWLCTDRRLLRTEGELPLSAVRSVERTGSRDVRYLVAGLASLTLAVLVPTLAVGAGVEFFAVVPLAAVLALGCPVGLGLWFRSSEDVFTVRSDGLDGTAGPWRLPADEEASAFVGTVRERLER